MKYPPAYADFPRGRHNAFTLVELLTTIGILSVLGAFCFAAIGRVKESSTRNQCAANLKQIGLAIQMYATDHNGYLPCMDNPSTGLKPWCGWADRILPYVKQTTIFECPATPEKIFEPGCPASNRTLDAEGFVYNFGGGYDLNRLTRKGHRYVSSFSLTHPADTIAALDGAGTIITPGFNPAPDILDGKVRPARHGKGHNILFADWHIKWMPRDALRERRLWWPQEKPPYDK
jgi:prepilin-type processing-associated H-X9-DG protein/prepilin-type N-terminal cleavage/methylation domain-containing protein